MDADSAAAVEAFVNGAPTDEAQEQTVPTGSSSSPSHMQDATMDNSSAFGYRSPSSFLNNGSHGPPNGSAGGLAGAASAGNTSPGHRLSLRDYDEQLNALRRENFNLKLRIYFLESNTPANVQADSKEALYKQNVDLKVDIEALRAELKEKQSLICEAATALNLIEQTQKANAAEHAAQCEELQQKIHFLELEVQALDGRDGGTTAANNRNLSEALARSTINSEAEQRINELQDAVRQLEAAAVQHAEQMADAEERAAVQEELAQLAEQQYASKCVEVEALKKNATAPLGVVRSPGRQGLARLDGGDAQLQQSVDDATLELRQQLADRECEIMTLQETMADKETAHDNGCKALLQMTIHAKQLEKELKKQQSMTSAWALENSTSTSTLPSLSHPVKSELHEQLANARKEAAQANAWRQECSDVCTALTVRLKELAEFLDTLLHNKEILGAIETERRKVMRRAVDSSIILSNSLHDMSVSGERFSLSFNNRNISALFADHHKLLHSQHSPNKSIANKTGAGTAADDGDDDKENVLPAQKAQHHQQLMLIANLRSEVRTLEAELLERKAQATEARPQADDTINNTASSINTSTKREQSRVNKSAANSDRHSESDACWSEPDRQVSQARIGLEDGASLRNQSASSNSANRTSPRKHHQHQAGCGGSDGESSLSSLDCGCCVSGKPTARVCESTTQLAALRGKHAEQMDHMLKQQQELIDAWEKEKQAVEENCFTRERNEATIVTLRNEIETLQNAKSTYDQLLDECRALCERLQADAVARDSEHHAELLALQSEHADELAAAVSSVRAQLQESEALVEYLRQNEAELHAQVAADEQRMRELSGMLDEVQVQKGATTAAMEKMRGDKYAALERVGELQKRVAQLEKSNAAMQNRLVTMDVLVASSAENISRQQQGQPLAVSQRHVLRRSASSGTSFMYGIGGRIAEGVSSSEERKQRLENSSPDLGIESDAGRTSGSETTAATRQQQQQQKRANMSAPASGLIAAEEIRVVVDEKESQIVTDTPTAGHPKSGAAQPQKQHDCALVDRDIVELKRKLAEMHQVHRQVLQQLRISNTRKEQVERDIRREITKTHTVLQTARSNIESAGVVSTTSAATTRQSTPPAIGRRH